MYNVQEIVKKCWELLNNQKPDYSSSVSFDYLDYWQLKG